MNSVKDPRSFIQITVIRIFMVILLLSANTEIVARLFMII